MNTNVVTKKVVLAFKDTNTNNTSMISSTSRSLVKKIVPPIVQTEAAGDKENVTVSKYSSDTTNETTKSKPIETKTGITYGNNVVVSKCKPNESKRDDRKLAAVTANDDDNVDVNTQSEPAIDIVQHVRVALIADDLTSDEPTPNYWKALAHKRGDALHEALNENDYLRKKIESLDHEMRSEKEQYLAKKVQLLEKENGTLKEALSQATEAIELFKEMLAEDEEDENEVSKDARDTHTQTINETGSCEQKIRTRTVHNSSYRTEDDAFGNNSTILTDSELSENESI